MKITAFRTTPLLLPYTRPFHQAQGARDAASVVLVEVETDSGHVGVGESISRPDAESVVRLLQGASDLVIGRDAHGVDAIVAAVRGRITDGPGSDMDRLARQAVAGLDFALWDLAGKAAGVPTHRLFGGPLHDHIGYFAFIDGNTPEELAEDAAVAVAAGIQVIYMKLGRGDDVDVAATAAVRAAIGETRLRLDANESWDIMDAITMIHRLARYGPEFIEQPVSRHRMHALKQVRDATSVPIAADQSIHSPEDVYATLHAGAADVIVVGPHEAGGLSQLLKAAAVAEAAGVRLCIHGTVETGITTCASHQAALAIANIDDGNQIMCQLIADDVIATPDLTLIGGNLGVWDAPGLGFTLDPDTVARAAERARQDPSSSR